MATSIYFRNTDSTNEQNLHRDLVAEVIRQTGIDVYYMPRTVINRDPILREPQIEKFDDSFFVDVYLETFAAPAGEGEFLSKFGVEIREQIILTMSKKTYFEEIASRYAIEKPELRREQPSEGDLIWVPMLKNAYQINHVSEKAIYFAFGETPTYKLTCQLFEYSNQIFETGLEEVDNKFNALSSVDVDELKTVMTSSQNEDIEQKSNNILFFGDGDFEGRKF